jgi:integrase
MLEIRATGGKTFYLRYQDARGRTRQLRLALERDVSLHQARKLAEQKRNMIAMGQDPCEAKAQTKSIPTFAAFIEEQYLPYVKSYKRSWLSDVSLLKNHLLPRFGIKYLDEITRQDILKMHCERKASGAAPGSANRLLIMMRFIFNLAVRWQLPGIKANPTQGLPLMEENNKKERYLSVEEAQRLYTAVCASYNPMLQYIVPMLILTGARKSEVLDAKWQDFDLLRRIWRIPTPKSGKARHVPLSDGVISLLGAMPRDQMCDWTFANPNTDKPYVNIFRSWDLARNKADLADVRLHDLRHSTASFLVNAGRTLYEVQHILGHTQVKTTQRYAHLSHDTLLDATNSINTTLGGMFMPLASTDPASSSQFQAVILKKNT